jgi:8-amino-7-oxononanoate synthase
LAKENSLDAFVKGKLDALEKRALRRVLVETARGPAAAAERGGRKLVSFCCNDYLNLSQSARVKEAAKAAIDAYGAGSGASRHITGNHPLYTELETRLARGLRGVRVRLSGQYGHRLRAGGPGRSGAGRRAFP